MMKTNLKPQLSPFASQTTTEYKFKAHVGKGGSVQTMPVNVFPLMRRLLHFYAMFSVNE